MKIKIINFFEKYRILLLGIFIASIISAICFHTDFMLLTKFAERVAGGNLNLYQKWYIGNFDAGMVIGPPLIYLLDGFLFYTFKLFHIVSFQFGNSVFDVPSLWFLFLLKARYLLVFVFSYFVVRKAAVHYTKNKKDAEKISDLWILSPVLLFLPFAQGNNDIYPVFFSLVFLLLVFKKKFILAMFVMGLVASMKNYGVFLVLPIAIVLSNKKTLELIKYLFLAGIGYVLPMFFYLKNISHFLNSNGEGLLIFSTIIQSRTNYYLFVILYFLIIFYLYFSDNEVDMRENTNDYVIKYSFLVMSLFYVFSFFIPQWFLWILPFFVFIIYKDKRLFYLYLLLISSLFVSLVTNWPRNLDLVLFKPIFQSISAENSFPGIAGLTIKSLVNSAFTAIYIAFIYFFLKKEKEDVLPKNYNLFSLLPLFGYLLLMLLFFIMFNIQ